MLAALCVTGRGGGGGDGLLYSTSGYVYLRVLNPTDHLLYSTYCTQYNTTGGSKRWGGRGRTPNFNAQSEAWDRLVVVRSGNRDSLTAPGSFRYI